MSIRPLQVFVAPMSAWFVRMSASFARLAIRLAPGFMLLARLRTCLALVLMRLALRSSSVARNDSWFARVRL
jgi:hypothetical protein